MPTKTAPKPEPKTKSGDLSGRTVKKRVRKTAKHRTLKLTKKQHMAAKPMPGIRSLFKNSLLIIFRNKWLFFGLTIIYSLLLFVLTKGFGSAFDMVSVRQEVIDALGDQGRSLGTSYELFNYLVGSFNTQVGDVAGTYQLFITLIIILATIWIARQLYAGAKPLLRDGFYKGMYPLIPFLCIVAVISLQLLPAVIGNFVFSTVLDNGLAQTFLEKLLWFLLFILLLMLSLYMVLSSIFALNIVALPDVRPFAALRSARNLVLHRRLSIFARLIVMPIAIFIVFGVIFIPLIMYATVLVEPLFLLLSSFSIIYAVVYMYNFYRELL